MPSHGYVLLRLRYGGREFERLPGVLTTDADTGGSMTLQLPVKPAWRGKCVVATYVFYDGTDSEAFFDYP